MASGGDHIIGIDASRAVGRVRTGTENYSAHIVRALVAAQSDYRWRLYFNGSANSLSIEESHGVEHCDIPARRLWTHVRLSRELHKHQVSGLFVPAHVVPLYHPATVVTIHDLGYLHWPDMHPPRDRYMLDLTTRWSAREARHIIVPSQQTAHDLMQFYRTPADKITVVHHGIDPAMHPDHDERDAFLREAYGLHRPYVLAVGTIQPRKNLGVLAQAMIDIVRQGDADLVIAGRPGWMYESVLKELARANLGDHLHLLNYVPAVDLPALYRHAMVFVQPSRFEGFGMPLLEAMACGTPVISAQGSSLDEIGGDATIRFPQDDVTELTRAISSVFADPTMRRTLRNQGIAHSASFTWQHAAKDTRIILETHVLH